VLPNASILPDALEYLASASAAAPAAGATPGYQPTPYGRLLTALPVSVEAAQLVAHGGRAGLLRPAVLPAALLNVTPLPIHQPFASLEQYRQNLRRYGRDDAEPADPQAVLLANLAASEFWQHAWCDEQRARRLRRLAAAGTDDGAADEGCLRGGTGHDASAGSSNSSSSSSRSGAGGAGGGAAPPDGDTGGGAAWLLPGVDPEEREWCQRHQLIASALHNVAELAQAMQAVLHIHRPDFLDSSYRPPPQHPADGTATAGGAAAEAAPPQHSCRLVAAARRWGVDAAAGASAQQCAAGAARLGDFYHARVGLVGGGGGLAWSSGCAGWLACPGKLSPHWCLNPR
jgi:HrpA-like RNA helicase